MINQEATAQISMDRQAITSGYHSGEVDAIGDVLGEMMEASARYSPRPLGMETSS